MLCYSAERVTDMTPLRQHDEDAGLCIFIGMNNFYLPLNPAEITKHPILYKFIYFYFLHHVTITVTIIINHRWVIFSSNENYITWILLTIEGNKKI